MRVWRRRRGRATPVRLRGGGGDKVGEVGDRKHEVLELLIPRVGSRSSVIGVTKGILGAASEDKASSIVDITKGVTVGREDVGLSNPKPSSNLDPDGVGESSQIGTGLVDVREGPLTDEVVRDGIEVTVVLAKFNSSHPLDLSSPLDDGLDVASRVADGDIEVGVTFPNLLAKRSKSRRGRSISGETGDTTPRLCSLPSVPDRPLNLSCVIDVVTDGEVLNVRKEGVKTGVLGDENRSITRVGERHVGTIVGGHWS